MKNKIISTLNSFNNCNAWEFGGKIYVDTLTGLSFLKKETGLEFEELYIPTKEEWLAALTGEGESHDKVFGGRVTVGGVFVVR